MVFKVVHVRKVIEFGFKIHMALEHGMARRLGEIPMLLMIHLLLILWKMEVLLESGDEC